MKQTRKALFVLLALVFLGVSLLSGLAVVSHSCCEFQSQTLCLDCAVLQQVTSILCAMIAVGGVLFLLSPATRRASSGHAPTLVLLKMRMNN